ncbi:MAG: hypothetical protein NTW05_18100 [Pseudonocardiales bacterium]|nr:hypothetical protein [Pseudonocardiales bacterium]
MSGGFRFDGIDAHIAEVDAQAARLTDVVAAAQPLDLDAYGIVGRLFAGAAAEAAGIAAGSVRRLGGSAAAVGEGLRRTRDGYLAAERAAAEAFTGIVP